MTTDERDTSESVGQGNDVLETPSSIVSYCDIRRREKFVVALFGVGIVLSLLMLARDVGEFRLASRLIHHIPVSRGEIDGYTRNEKVLQVFWVVWHISIVVAFLMWIYRAHRNLPALGATHLEFTLWGAVGWYFAPFANLFKPYQCMREIYNASDFQHPSADTGFEIRTSAPAVVKAWWAFFLFFCLFSNAGAMARSDVDGPVALQIASVMSLIEEILSISAMIAAILVVRSVSRRQLQRAATLGLASSESPATVLLTT
jgi:hypothetical protein